MNQYGVIRISRLYDEKIETKEEAVFEVRLCDWSASWQS